jgi:hypothetical protein
MDFDDGHLCGYDRAFVCSDRFSWFAVSPTPVYCDGTLPPILSKFTRFHRAAARRSKLSALISGLCSSPDVTISLIAQHWQNSSQRAKCERAEPMKRHDLSTI